jgi:hypothetical protein
MAQPAPTPFAVDTDITPLQGRFFDSVTKNVSDPRLRSQLYDQVRSTFGGIQQARDIQRAKLQEDEERSINLELRRAQLDQSKLELGLARDKVRQQQNATAKTQEFDSAFDDFVNYELDGLSPEEGKKRLNMFGAQYADVVTYNPAAKAKLELTNNSLETKRQSSGLTTGTLKDLGTVGNDKAAENLLPGSTQTLEYQTAKLAAAQKQADRDRRTGLAANIATSSVAEKLADKMNKDLAETIDTGGTPRWSTIDVTLKELDKFGFITPEEKVQLLEYGIDPLKKKGDATKVKGKKTLSEGLDILQNISAAAYARAVASRANADAQINATPAETDPVDSLFGD